MPDPLVVAALECFADHGVRGTSLTDVAARAGVSRATAYRAFGDKPGLIAAVTQAEVVRYTEELARRVDLTADLETTARQTIDFTLGYLRRHAALQRVLADEPEQIVDVIVQRPGRTTVIELVRGAAQQVLEGHPQRDRLRATPEQVAELGVRVVFSLLLAPETTLHGGEQLADLLLRGAAKD